MFAWLRRKRTVIEAGRTKLRVIERRRFSFGGLPDVTGDDAFDDTMFVLASSTTHALAVMTPEVRAELLAFAKDGEISFRDGKLVYIAEVRPRERLQKLAEALATPFPNYDSMHARMAETFAHEPHPGVRVRLSEYIHPGISPQHYAKMQALARNDEDSMVRARAAIRDQDEPALVSIATAAPERTREHIGFWIASYGSDAGAAALLKKNVVSSFYTLKLAQRVPTDAALLHTVAMTHTFQSDLYLLPLLEMLFKLDETLATEATRAKLLPVTYEYEKKLTDLYGRLGGREALRALQAMPETADTKRARLQIITRLGNVDAGGVSLTADGGELSAADDGSASPRAETPRS